MIDFNNLVISRPKSGLPDPLFFYVDMSTLKNKIAALLPDHLVLLDFVLNKSQPKVQIVIDGIIPVDLNTTTQIARTVRDSGVLDEAFPGGFQLEVTSPGLALPLKHPVQFRKNKGRKVIVRQIGESSPTTVEICQVNDSSFEGRSPKGIKSWYQFDEIESAIVEIKF